MKTYTLAMIGMVEGNGHPYSWSAIFNGYNKDKMALCPYPVIPQYLNAIAPENLKIPNAKVTHIWTDDPNDALAVSQASIIPNILKRPEDAIGAVDAVIISTDIGHEHLRRARPFINAKIPIFIDKPLTDNVEDLKFFSSLINEGAPIISSSCMRYAKEFAPYHQPISPLGPLRYVSITTPKSWERYGIHAIESIYPILGPGFISLQNTGTREKNIVHIRHQCGADVHVIAIQDLYAGFGVLQLLGPKDCVQTKFADTFSAFKKQLEAFVSFLDTGERPFPYKQTEEMMKILIAGIMSREQNAREVYLDEVII